MAAPAHLTAAEYFAIDDARETKHELVEGVIYAMAGGTPAHALLSARFARIVGTALLEGGCDVYSSDLRVALKDDTFAYPDVTVVCGAPEVTPEDANTVTNPKLVVEVLSPSTEDYDRGRKADLYRNTPSVATLVLVSTRSAIVETHERQSDESWVLRRFEGLEAVAPLPSVGASVPLGELYQSVKLSG